MKAKTLVKVLTLVGACTVLSVAHSAVSATTVTSFSTGLAANLSVANLVNVGVGPVAFASGTAPSPYSVNQTLLSLNTSGNLLLGSLGANTGVIVDTASSNYLPTLSGTATSTVNGLGSNLSLALLGSILDITATTLTSTSTASDFGSLTLTGSSLINNLYISGTALGGPGIHVNASGLASTPVDDILVNVGGLVIVSNYQSPIYDGATVDGIQTTALAIGLNNFAFGTGVLNGIILIADSGADIPGAPTAVPEPATWAMMLTGFGMLGAISRRRRIAAAV